MNVDDLRVILGRDGEYRRNFSIKISDGNMSQINFDILRDGVWSQDQVLIHESQLNPIIAQMNVRRCLFFIAYRKAIETSRTVRMYSGQVV